MSCIAFQDMEALRYASLKLQPLSAVMQLRMAARAAPGEIKEGLAIVIRDLNFHRGLRVDLNQDEGELQGRRPRPIASVLGEHACRFVAMPQEQVPVCPVLLARLLRRQCTSCQAAGPRVTGEGARLRVVDFEGCWEPLLVSCASHGYAAFRIALRICSGLHRGG